MCWEGTCGDCRGFRRAMTSLPERHRGQHDDCEPCAAYADVAMDDAAERRAEARDDDHDDERGMTR